MSTATCCLTTRRKPYAGWETCVRNRLPSKGPASRRALIFRYVLPAKARVTDGDRTRDLRSHNSMPPVTVRPSPSGYSAYLWGFRRFRGMRLSAAYYPVPARLHYGCSSCVEQMHRPRSPSGSPTEAGARFNGRPAGRSLAGRASLARVRDRGRLDLFT
jgi:hypothetical protein